MQVDVRAGIWKKIWEYAIRMNSDRAANWRRNPIWIVANDRRLAGRMKNFREATRFGDPMAARPTPTGNRKPNDVLTRNCDVW